MRNHAKWASGEATISSYSVGPRHDPYHREEVEISVRGHDYRLFSCGLAGEWMEEDKREVARLAEPLRMEDRRAAWDAYVKAVEERTGHGPYFWLRRLWQRVDTDRARRWPEYYEVMAADARLLAYAE